MDPSSSRAQAAVETSTVTVTLIRTVSPAPGTVPPTQVAGSLQFPFTLASMIPALAPAALNARRLEMTRSNARRILRHMNSIFLPPCDVLSVSDFLGYRLTDIGYR
jgi:hypothetical protein